MSLCNIFRPFSAPAHPKPNHIPIATTSTTKAPTPSSPRNVTIIELFQSQGCNSCPPANDACIALAARNDPSQLLLTYEVTYWDHLGWPDTFGDERWDDRQREYVGVLRQRSIYTPQVLVDGGASPMGSSWRNLPAVLAKKDGSRENVTFEFVDGIAKLSIVGQGRGIVLAVFYEVEPAPVKILRGENRGETLPHRNIVRDMELVGTWEGGDRTFDLPPRRAGLEMAILVQAGKGGYIIGATRV